MKHANIALFVPHNGCPHQCSFCNQRSITGKQAQPSAEDVFAGCRRAAETLGEDAKKAEIAFFGGSFTAIDRDYMQMLLEAAGTSVKQYGFAGIRVSTRPDAVPDETLRLLARYPVTAIELGAQSMADEVLRLNQRGHSARDVLEASGRIKRYGFSLGLQMMTGLYGSTPELDDETAKRIASLEPDTVRIYPTVVMKNTELGRLYQAGLYHPPGLEETIGLCGRLLLLFDRRHIPVIRLGLHDTPELHRDMLAGAWHPALRELCESRMYLHKAEELLIQKRQPLGPIVLRVHPRCLSKMIGQKKENVLSLLQLGWQAKIVPDPSVEEGQIVFDH